ncbi:uncharacterized protein LOC129284899 isoform X2 [Prosopis cineraria]|uniref:uncharacterized protein LOC129284899 isoform X2 n=1 Tax=Prosopis cineraria TaxID=364024 RepID=UPI00240FCFAB|nr:uncharacterized protein LOC129284899 isoform X2 [Prosopis cineraria]XP_054776414.1 uncharacterized protein LOC129284899 isoform X2 [Prosopis cineraria]XP_054776423.1 uncharacterized protein LOC129284899 isoform X2 [Prosopis cineraria]
MVIVQASKLTLPNPSLFSPHITSILCEPTSHSLALMHSDSSFSLYPSFSPSSSFPSLHTLIPSPSSSSTFLLLQSSNPNFNPRVLFIVCGPHRAGSEILLRFYILRKSKVFAKARVICSQKDLRFQSNLGVLVNVKHGVSIKLAGSINYFAMYSVSSSKIWVFGAKMEGSDEGDDDGVVVKLMRCAVLECPKPIWSLSVSFGFLLLGEEHGVRVFNLRRLVKGRDNKAKNSKLDSRGSSLPNGVVGHDCRKHGASDRGGKNRSIEGVSGITCNGDVEWKTGKHHGPVKQMNAKFRQDDRDGSTCFVSLKRYEMETKLSGKVSISTKAVSIQALSQRKFLVLDSDGDLHLLCLSNSVMAANISGHMRKLPHTMKVQNMAILPDVSLISQTVWISDGHNTVHVLAIDMDNALNATDGNDGDDKLLHLPVVQVIFSGERIQDVVSLASDVILILGQGSQHSWV